MIANCPSCGTHYKHERPQAPVTVRCGRCDTTLDLTRFRPYRIVQAPGATQDDAIRTANYLPIGLDHPQLAATIAVNIAHRALTPAPPPVPVLNARDDDPMPSSVEIAPVAALGDRPVSANAETRPAAADAEPTTEPPELETPEPGGWAGFVLWVATAAVAGTAASWSMEGTLTAGLAAGAATGAAAWWGWRRWTSPR